ncbi:hypothetical protein [Branchiibius cervicis]|uniref:GatB/YqeY domain-containing protein n=1 Tax=Branchiibius cervicis TaxID=908252 RepID=A0ABW2ATQ8_9MICO
MTDSLVDQLRAALRDAMVERDRDLVAALRSCLAVIDNATSKGIAAPRAGAIEVSVAGLSAAEVPRRQLTGEDIEALVDAELADRVAAADELEAAGRGDQAQVMRETTERLRAATQPG